MQKKKISHKSFCFFASFLLSKMKKFGIIVMKKFDLFRDGREFAKYRPEGVEEWIKMTKKIRRRLWQAVGSLMILVLCASCAPARETGSDYVEKEHRPGVPEGPYVVANSTVGVTGDILVHTPLITSAARIDYDFSENYTYITDYYSRYDLMIANLEVTLGGTDAGAYVGYPTFNCPDT